MPNTDKIQSTFTSNRICHFTLVHFMVDDPFMGVLGVCDKAGSRGWEGCRVTSMGRGSPMPDTARSSRPTAGHRRARVGCLWESVSEKGQKRPHRDKKGTKRVRHSRGNTTVRRGGGGERGAPGTQADIPHPAACGGPHTGADGCFLKELWPMESICWSRFFSRWQLMGKAHTSAGKKWERDGAAERNCFVMTVHSPPLLHCLQQG